MPSHRRGPTGRAARGRKPGAGPPPVYEWERRLGEGPEAYAAFLVYRDLGAERSLERLRQRWAKGGPRPPGLSRLKIWSSKWAWTFRVDAWEAHLQKIVDDQIRKTFTEQVERHMALGDGALVVTSKLLENMVQQVLAGQVKMEDPVAMLTMVDRLVGLQAKIAAEAALRLERSAATGQAAGAREELERRLGQMASAYESAAAALEERAKAAADAVAALQGRQEAAGAPPPAA